ncbi:MAG: hypothetical protein COW42_13585 [Deltaproteobacteria bacterium CG17_big_fil_post_rev_8_21_14_2_50_63_7]|nr:MAG: hypothetical protein COW42_13585 [Deltaproteobacteria bacterium CG17_big_fil_post_rev_8_21_14_2_50_63_7]
MVALFGDGFEDQRKSLGGVDSPSSRIRNVRSVRGQLWTKRTICSLGASRSSPFPDLMFVFVNGDARRRLHT